MAEWIRALDYGVSDQLIVGPSPGHDTCILWKQDNSKPCSVLQMGCTAVGPVCCVTHIEEPGALNIEKRRGSPLCSWVSIKGAYVYM